MTKVAILIDGGFFLILEPLWSNIGPDLYEHIDGLRSGFARPRSQVES